MRWLIDGYNVMHAAGWLGPRLGREGFRRARRRFLDDLVGGTRAGSVRRDTTVVFDASAPPGRFRARRPAIAGLASVFALGDENADARIEQLIAEDSNPKTLTVVSSDRRIRQAAARRQCRSVTADEFWELIDELKERQSRSGDRRGSPARPPR